MTATPKRATATDEIDEGLPLRPSALSDEFITAACSIDADGLAALLTAGIKPTDRDGAPLVGMAQIQVHRGGLFDIADPEVGGDMAVLAGWWQGLGDPRLGR